MQPDVPRPEIDYFQISLLSFEPTLSVPLVSAPPQPIPSYYPDL
jgi:hypothetical protein